MKRSMIRRTIRHKDPVTPEVRYAVLKRDAGCIAARVGMPGLCGSQFGPSPTPTLELDHVNGNGMGKRGPSIPENLVVLCGLHHRMKTEQSRVWRVKLNDYLRSIYGGDA